MTIFDFPPSPTLGGPTGSLPALGLMGGSRPAIGPNDLLPPTASQLECMMAQQRASQQARAVLGWEQDKIKKAAYLDGRKEAILEFENRAAKPAVAAAFPFYDYDPLCFASAVLGSCLLLWRVLERFL